MKKSLVVICWIALGCLAGHAFALPNDFVYLKDVDPTILQEIRYAQDHNFIGRPVTGYEASTCILTRKAALALHQVQLKLRKSHLSLKVYDCYRPQKAVDDFVQWSKVPTDETMKAEFYPRVDKAELFNLGYVAKKSGHTRGSTVDLTLVAIPAKASVPYKSEEPLVACFKPYHARYQDNSIDMGTGYDCLDPTAFVNNHHLDIIALKHRQWLSTMMKKYHFVPYEKEWWHFTLKDEPYPDTYFNFPVKNS